MWPPPYAGGLLADLGAEVINIEPPPATVARVALNGVPYHLSARLE